MAFWNLNTVEPKRSFRYKVTFGANSDTVGKISLFAQKVDKPSFTVEKKEYQYLNHTFNYPGRVKWSEINMEFVDAGRGPAGGELVPVDVATTLMGIITSAGYVIPSSVSQPTAELTTPSKSKLVGQTGKEITIEQLNADGLSVETWKIYNAMFLDVGYGSLSYDTDEISKITVKVAYDYATIQNGEQASTTLPSINTTG
jgi:hypothetical protein